MSQCTFSDYSRLTADKFGGLFPDWFMGSILPVNHRWVKCKTSQCQGNKFGREQRVTLLDLISLKKSQIVPKSALKKVAVSQNIPNLITAQFSPDTRW